MTLSSLKQRMARTLRWSERYTKTDMIYLARGSFWLMAGQAAGMVITLGLAVAFSHLASKEAYGTYRFILSFSGLLGALSLTGITTALIQGVASGRRDLLLPAVLTNLKWSGGIVIAGIAGAFYYYLNDNLLLAGGLLVVGIMTPLLQSTNLYLPYLNGIKDFRSRTLWSVLQIGGNAAALSIMLLISDNPLLLVAIFFVSQSLFGVIGLWHSLQHERPEKTTAATTEFMSYSKRLSIINVISTIGSNIDALVLFHFLGAAPVAVYYFATAIPNQLNGIIKNVYILALPRFAQYQATVVRESLLWKITISLGASLVLAGSYILAAPMIFELLFPQYLDAVPYSQLLALNIVLSGAIIIFTTYFEAHRMVRAQASTTILNACTRIPLMIVLTPIFGIVGLVSAYLISRLLVLLVDIWWVGREHYYSRNEEVGTSATQ